MLSTQKYHDPSYRVENWVLYGVGVATIALRYFVRLRSVGLSNFKGDDGLTLIVLACLTSDALACRNIQLHGSNVDWSKSEMEAMTDQERRWIAYGSKLEMVCWFTYPTLVWSLKGCMLFFFNRLTLGLDTQKMVKWMAYACGISYVLVILVTSLSCLPFNENWATINPYPRPACSTRFQDMYTVTILNVLTDAAMLCIPLPLLWRLQVPLGRKLALCVLLLGGVFVITAAVVRIAMSLQASPSTMNINRWGLRETLAGVLAVNVPIIRPLFGKRFWLDGQLSSSGAPSHSGPSSGTGRSRIKNPFRSSKASKDAFEMLDPNVDRPQFHPEVKNCGTNTTVRAYGSEGLDGDSEREASDTASEDLIIQKHYKREKSHTSAPRYEQDRASVDAELERGTHRGGRRGSPAEQQQGGVTVTTTYSVRSATPGGKDWRAGGATRSEVESPSMRDPAELDGRVGQAR